MAAVAAASQ